MKSHKFYILIITLLILVLIVSFSINALFLLSTKSDKKIPDYNYKIAKLIKYSEQNNTPLKISELRNNDWNRACILGPYWTASTNELNFDWDINQHTNVLQSDGHTVLVFLQDETVIDFVVQNRAHGDLSKFSGSCFNDEDELIF